MTNPLIYVGDLRQATNGAVVLSLAGDTMSRFTLAELIPMAIEYFKRNDWADEYLELGQWEIEQ